MKKNSTLRSKILLCTLFSVALCAALTALATSQHNTAQALEGVTQYKRGDFVKYSDHETAWMTFDGIHGTCAMPWKIAPPSGTYHYTSNFKTLPNSKGQSHSMDMLSNYLYYGYGGPGFDKTDPAWPTKNRFGKPMTKEDYMVATHILVASAYTCDTSRTLHGTSGDEYRWFAWNIIGSAKAAGTDQNNPNSPGIAFRQRPSTLNRITPIAIMPGGQWQTCISYKVKNTTLKLIKTDSASGNTPQRGLSLEGATFEARDEQGNVYAATSTTTDGVTSIIFDDIPFEKITIRETAAPEGYLPITEPIEIDLTKKLPNKDNIVVIENAIKETPIAFDLQITKFLDDLTTGSGLKQPGSGISFDVISNTTNETVATLTTDKDGIIDTTKSTNWYGTGSQPLDAHGSFPFDPAGYTIHENADTTPTGHTTCPDWTISAQDQLDGICLKYIVSNEPVASRLQIVKVDTESNLPIAKAGFTFEIYDAEKHLISQESWYPNHCQLSQFTTDDSGCVTFPEQLLAGTYYIKEVSAPAPYLTDNTYHEFTVSNESTSPSISVIPIKNKAAEGQLTIIKQDSLSNEQIEGASFELRAKDDIIGADGTLLAGKDELVASPQSDNYQTAHGKIILSNLPLDKNGQGQYILKETQSPEGFILPEETIDVVIQAQDGCPAVVEETVTVENNPNEVIIQKVSQQDNTLQLPGATFVIWNVEDEIIEEDATDEAEEQSQLTAIDTQRAPHVLHPKQVLTKTTDKDGKIYLSHLKPGTYKWVEVEAPQGYVLSEPTIHSFSVTVEGHILIGDESSINATITVENTPTHIVIEKRDDTSEEFIEGATLSLYKADEDGIPLDKPIKTWKTADTGIDIYGLAPGSYVIKEDQAPHNYQKIDSLTFEVINSSNLQTIVVYNHKLDALPPETTPEEPPRTMPQTGTPVWPQWMGNSALASGAVLFLILCIHFIFKSRK